MRLAKHVMELLKTLKVEDLEALPPAERRRFADYCRHCAQMAEPEAGPKAGVLHDLKRGQRSE